LQALISRAPNEQQGVMLLEVDYDSPPPPALPARK
jgi:hypothetical protein